ncbi:hypothetical protein SUNI508_03424 [Seiridium unicorne]|uniref:C2H2-type domain-containing protein n=1 Tax=Seiridium unicorne TaxID=138068 RepID=A0ABR2VCD2_9PEZI
MSDYIQDFDLTAALGANEPTLEDQWLPPAGEDFDFSALIGDEGDAIDPGLLEMPTNQQYLGFTDFSVLQPAYGGFDLAQSKLQDHNWSTVNESVSALAPKPNCRSPTLISSVSSWPQLMLQPPNNINIPDAGSGSSNGAYQHGVDLLAPEYDWQSQDHANAELNLPSPLALPRVVSCVFEGCHQSFNHWSERNDHQRLALHYRCMVPECGQQFASSYELQDHAREKQHESFTCNITGCRRAFIVREHRDGHQSHLHSQDHYQVEGNHPLACIECGEILPYRAHLQAHANLKQHSPFQCICGKKFARLDVLHRHFDSYGRDMPKFPCTFCKSHRGKLGFRRRDHLVQHLRGYHKFDLEEINQISPALRDIRLRNSPVCPHVGCEYHRDSSFRDLPLEQQLEDRPFTKQSDFSKHLKEVHDETPFPCKFPGCDKVGGKGYIRQKDLMKHQTAKHPEFA